MFLIIIFLSLTGNYLAFGSIKRWSNSLLYEDINNWSTKKIPGLTDRIVIPSSMEVPIIFPKTTGFCELVIAEDGDIVFPEDSNVSISSTTMNLDCSGSEIKFLKHQKAYWLDPANWIADINNGATPHMEQLPCTSDIVVFPTSSSFTIVLPSAPIILAGFQIAGRDLNNEELRIMMRNELFGEEFTTDLGPSYDSDILTISSSSNNRCNDETGCECGNGQFYNFTCNLINGRCNPDQINCLTPIKPVGHCCKICGEYLLLTYDPSIFKYNKVEQLVKGVIEDEIVNENIDIDYHISKISDGQIHVILADNGQYDAQAKNIPSTIRDTILGRNDLGISEIAIHSSGPAYNPNSWHSPGNLLFTALLIVILIIVIIVIYNRHIISSIEKRRAFGFVKFENQSGGLGDEIVELEVASVERTKTGTSFVNPMFAAAQKVEKEASSSKSEILTTSDDTENSSIGNLIEIPDGDDEPVKLD